MGGHRGPQFADPTLYGDMAFLGSRPSRLEHWSTATEARRPRWRRSRKVGGARASIAPSTQREILPPAAKARRPHLLTRGMRLSRSGGSKYIRCTRRKAFAKNFSYESTTAR